MGLVCSGEVSDLAFLELVEKPFLLKQEHREEFGIVGYCRFKDDLLLITRGSLAKSSELISRMRSLSGPFKLKVESVSKTCVNMLDVTLFVQERNNLYRISARPYVKATSNWTPLSCTSMHAPHVHANWPSAYVSRLRGISTWSHDYRVAKKSFLSRLASKCSQHTFFSQQPKKPKSIPIAPNPHHIMYFVLPLWFGWNSRSLISSLDALHLTNLSHQPAVKVSWCLGGRHAV